MNIMKELQVRIGFIFTLNNIAYRKFLFTDQSMAFIQRPIRINYNSTSKIHSARNRRRLKVICRQKRDFVFLIVEIMKRKSLLLFYHSITPYTNMIHLAEPLFAMYSCFLIQSLRNIFVAF